MKTDAHKELHVERKGPEDLFQHESSGVNQKAEGDTTTRQVFLWGKKS